MIDQPTIDRILDAAQIVDVVSEFVSLKKRGVNYVGLCPFHDDKTPSFYVSPAKGLCKCFACGKGGNAVHFIMEHEQMSYPEALRFLAKKYNIEIKERELTQEEKQKQTDRESLFIVNNFARDYFQHILKYHAEGQSLGMAYFRSRGFRDDIIEKFQLGYCIDSHDALASEALKRGYKKEYLVKTGLCYETDDHRLRDRFWGRVIFPVHTLSGKVVAFGGRVLNSQTKGVKVKYVNSPESDIYHKSNELYGIYFAKQAITKQDRCYLVEGYTDVISMHQTGVENVVSSSGTALTAGQIKLIHRFTNNITVLYDGDAAGIKASIRGIDMLLAEGMYIKVCLLPDGEDPDSFARHHSASEFQSFINEHETDFIRFKTNLLLAEAGKDPIKRAELISNIVQSIAVIPEAIVRDVYIKECGQLLHVEDKLLVSEVAKRRETVNERTYRPTIESSTAQQQTSASTEQTDTNCRQPDSGTAKNGNMAFYKYERQLIQVVIRYGEKMMYEEEDESGNKKPVNVIEYIAKELKQDELSFHFPIHNQILKEALEHSQAEHFIAERYFIAHPDSKISSLASELASERYQLSKVYTKTQKVESEEDKLIEVVPMLILSYKNAIVTTELKSIMQELQNPDIVHDDEKCSSLMKRYQKFKEIENMMAKQLGDRVVLR